MGFLARSLARIRLATDEPSINAKYTDATLIGYIESAYAVVLADVNRMSKRPVVVRYDIAVGTAQTIYTLPPTVGSIVDIQWLDTAGNIVCRHQPTSLVNPSWPGITLEANTIRFLQTPTSAYTLRICFVPTGCVHLHDGTASTITNSLTAFNCTIILAATPTTGSLDKRPNAYVGSLLHILTATTNDYPQLRLITAYDCTTRTATLEPNFTAALLPGGATVTYEIAPIFAEQIDTAIPLWVAQYVAGMEGFADRAGLLQSQYERAIRQIRLAETHYDTLRQHGFEIVSTHAPGSTLGEMERLDGLGRY